MSLTYWQDGNRDIAKEILENLETETTLDTTKDFNDVPQTDLKAALDRQVCNISIQKLR
jgi:uncharacterized protein (DUF433 family)